MLTGTTTRTISTVVVVALIIAIPLLVFVPGFQTAAITLLELGIDSLDILTQSTGTAVTLISIAVTLVAVYFTLKQRRGDREGQIAEHLRQARYDLGNNSLDVRLGAIYALERIARDSRQDHWPIMEILTAYVREHARRDPSTEDQEPAADNPRLATDIQAALTAIGRRKTDYDPPEQVLDLRETGLRGADLDNANLQGAILVEVNLQGAELREANLRGTHLNEAILRGAILGYAQLQGAILWTAQLQGANLIQANLQGARLIDAKLQRATLVRVELQEANLSVANLQGAFLMRADLADADLQWAILDQAKLQGADLSKAIGLTSQQLEESFGDEYTKLPSGVERPDHWPAEHEDAG